MFVYRHIDSVTTSAYHNTQFAVLTNHIPSYRMAKVRVIDGIQRKGSSITYLVAKMGEVGFDRFFKRKPRMV